MKAALSRKSLLFEGTPSIMDMSSGVCMTEVIIFIRSFLVVIAPSTVILRFPELSAPDVTDLL